MKQGVSVLLAFIAIVFGASSAVWGQSVSVTQSVKTLRITEDLHGRHPMVMISLEKGEIHKMPETEADMKALAGKTDLFVEVDVPELGSLGWPEPLPAKFRRTENLGDVGAFDFMAADRLPPVKEWTDELKPGEEAKGYVFAVRTKRQTLYLLRIAEYSKGSMTLEYRPIEQDTKATDANKAPQAM